MPTFNERWPWMEDDLWWKTTIDGRQPLMEDDLRWKMTFDGRRLSMEDDLQWKTTVSGRRPSLERFRDSPLPYTAVTVIFSCYLLNQNQWSGQRKYLRLRQGVSCKVSSYQQTIVFITWSLKLETKSCFPQIQISLNNPLSSDVTLVVAFINVWCWTMQLDAGIAYINYT